MKILFTSTLVALGLIIAIGVSAQTIVITNGAQNPSCGNRSFTIGLNNCPDCMITKWEELSVDHNAQPPITVLYTYQGAPTYTATLTAPSERFLRPWFTRPGVQGEMNIGYIRLVADLPPVAGTLSTPTTAFLNSGSGQLTLTGASGKVKWSHLGLPATPVNGTVTSNFSITTSQQFLATVTGPYGACSSVSSNPVTINVYKTGTLTGPSSVIEGQKVKLGVGGNKGNAIHWEYSTDGGATWTSFDYLSYRNGPFNTGDRFADTHEIWTNTKFRVLIDLGPFGSAYTNTLDVTYVPYTQANVSSVNGSNYVRIQDVVVSGITDPASVDALAADQKRKLTTYQDGMGRAVQQNVQGATPLQKDLITMSVYDNTGRESQQYLPYVSSSANGGYRVNALSEQSAYYANGTADKVADSPYPYAQTVFDKSPLGRIREQGNVGQGWQPGSGHTTRIEYSNNIANEIRLINADLTSTGFYGVNELSKIETTDPDGKKKQTITDKAGRTIVSRTQLDETVGGVVTPWLETYYIYNQNGSIKYIIPPKGVAAVKATGWVVSATLRDQYFHQFVYDKFGRLIEKKVPDQTWMYYCYDRFDRLILVQDGYTRASNKWLYIKYDRKNRPVMQGLYTNTTYTSRAELQTNVIDPLFAQESDKFYEDRGTANHGYTNQCFPTAGTEVLTVNYYDSYDFDFNGTADYGYVAQGLPNENTPATSAQVRGLPTGSKRVIPGTTTWLYSYVFYSSRGEAIQVRSNNHLRSTIDNLSTAVYDFEGKALTSKMYHNAGTGKVTTVINKMQYDHMGRLTKVFQNNNGAAQDQLLVKYEYNELGQLVDKKLHETSSGNNTFLQSVDFRYSIQGWLTSINNAQITNDNGVTNDETTDYFGMEFLYEKTQSGLTTTANSLYNGNISAIKWKAPGTASGAADQRSYKFTYDKANRFKTAISQISTTATSWTKEATALNESVTAYDLNGNITGLQRRQRKHILTVTSSSVTVTYGNELIDNLTFTYAANRADQLVRVTDATNRSEGFDNGPSGTNNDFTYDNMGSLLTDRNKGIDANILYNEFGKPVQVTHADGRKVEYVYDAAGIKLTMKTYETGGTLKTTTDYVGSFVYENGTLSFFSSPEGRVVRNASGALEYQYAITDHQGNTRVVFSSVNSSETHLATFEDITADSQKFGNLTSNTFYWVSSPPANNTPGGSRSLRLNSTYNATGDAPGIAAVKSLSVVPGDVVSVEVYAYYFGSSGFGGTSQPLTALVASVAGSVTSGLPAGEANAITSGINSAYTSFGTAPNRSDEAPSAFLNYILLDKNYKLLDMGWQPVPTTANGAKQKVAITPRNIKEPGYMYVYLSYEGDGTNWVHFDDLEITHTKSNVVQYNEYYPFGSLTGNSWTRENSSNNFLYNQGSELNQTTGWYEMMFRNYDAVLGRLTAIDPMATKYASFSGYHYAYNNPLMFNDPSGADPQQDAYISYMNAMAQVGREVERWYADKYSFMAGYRPSTTNPWATAFMTDQEWIAYTNPAGPSAADLMAIQWTAEAAAIGRRHEQKVADWKATLDAMSRGAVLLPEVEINDLRQGRWPSWWGQAQQAGPGPVIPLGAWVDPSSLKLKKIGEAWYGTAHIDEEIGVLKLPFRGYVRVHLNTTVNFLFSANGPYAKKDAAQYYAATAMDRARVSVMQELYANPGLSSSSAASDFKHAFGVHLMFLTFGSEVKKDSYIFQGNVPTSEVRFQWFPSLPPRTGQHGW